jgi:hypothetical protein
VLPHSQSCHIPHTRNLVKIPVDVAIFHNQIQAFHGDEEWLDHQLDVIDIT